LSGDAHRPLPVPDEQSAGYWAAAADHVLALARCMQCGRLAHPPAVVCPGCLHPNPGFEFSPVDGAGTVRSWTVIRDSFLPGFDDRVPLVLVDVELDVQTGLRLIGRLVDGIDAELHLGDRVTTVFDDLGPGIAVPAFALAGGP
jgi:uncharacterized OB-fold protein